MRVSPQKQTVAVNANVAVLHFIVCTAGLVPEKTNEIHVSPFARLVFLHIVSTHTGTSTSLRIKPLTSVEFHLGRIWPTFTNCVIMLKLC